MNSTKVLVVLAAALAVAALTGCAPDKATTGSVTPEQARAIAKEAYIYASPMVDSYRVMHGSFVDQGDPEYKAPWNQLLNLPRVYTPDDRAVQTPNSDTPYSWLGMDLRTEPLVLTVPPMDGDRYFSIQLIDLYTHNFDYIGSRTTGNDGGNYLIAGPGWQDDTPDGISQVFRSETGLALAIYRTQLFDPEDIENVKAIQAGYQARPLSAFLDQPAPEPAPAIDFIPPLTRDEIRESPKVFEQLNFVLQFCPTHPSEQALVQTMPSSPSGPARPSTGTSSHRKPGRPSARASPTPGRPSPS